MKTFGTIVLALLLSLNVALLLPGVGAQAVKEAPLTNLEKTQKLFDQHWPDARVILQQVMNEGQSLLDARAAEIVSLGGKVTAPNYRLMNRLLAASEDGYELKMLEGDRESFRIRESHQAIRDSIEADITRLRVKLGFEAPANNTAEIR